MKNKDHIVVLLPKNDPESIVIGELCHAFSIPTVVSDQPHGAYLAAEKKIEERVRQANQNVKEIIIIEIPGIEEEEKLRKRGFQVTLIDHHRYEGLDRMHKKSSLEQFIELFDISNEEISHAGFNPMYIKGVAVIDRSFVWGLSKEGFSQDQRKEIIEYYQSFLYKMYGKDRKAQEQLARELYEKRKTDHGFLIIQNTNPDIGVRDALSFEIAKHYSEPVPTIIYSTKMIYVQESERAKEFYEEFGGFMYGGEDRCWGKHMESKDELQKIASKIGVTI